jgi:hypothetical protein
VSRFSLSYNNIIYFSCSEHTNIQKILEDFNTLHRNLHYTAEGETDHALNYLDVSQHRPPTNIRTFIYRKPTSTDTITPFTSSHSTQHKYAAVRYLYDRLNSYSLQNEEYQHELNTIHNILYNNSFPIKHNESHTHDRPKHTTKQNWATFTYVGKETLYITNIIRKTHHNIAFRTTNTIGNLLSSKTHAPDKFSRSGVYKLTCPDCHKAYVGQTGRQFSTRYKEHQTFFRNKNNSSNFAKHLNL